VFRADGLDLFVENVILLLVAAAVALAWASSPWAESYVGCDDADERKRTRLGQRAAGVNQIAPDRNEHW
jgi:hypothetical protein